MAIPKICGIETEYAVIQPKLDEQNPIHASSVLVNAYAKQGELSEKNGVAYSVEWDFNDETPDNDARGFTPIGSLPPLVETHLVNAVLENGARFYVDHAHPEISTPECINALQAVKFDRSGEQILQKAMTLANEMLSPEEEIIVYKDNSDGKGNSYGCHENYLVDRTTPFGEIICHATAHFITRQIFTGSGKIGVEATGIDPNSIQYQLTQRADFFEEEVGLETTLKRPIINTRDEPHADATKYRRLHVICGDANMSETATFLKVGSTSILLAMIEDNYMTKRIIFDNPVRSMREVSHDTTLKKQLLLGDRSNITALEAQWEIFKFASTYVDKGGAEFTGGYVAEKIISTWERVLTGLEKNPETLRSEIDWIAKKLLIESYAERHNLSMFDPKVRLLALQYHDIRQDKRISEIIGLKKLIAESEIIEGIENPPEETRAYFRGVCLQKWPESIVSANWDSLVFRIEGEHLRRIPIPDPSEGSSQKVRTLLNRVNSPAELIAEIELTNK
ncbi:MAG: proteasome accessory factor PafA2 [Acidimicrobiaceae bacterium]|nr:proteasome accessory factor PafA2 [Acidimicrobiaceae bacterium]